MSAKKNKYTQLLSEAIDETGVMERKKWGEYLFVTPSTISQWVNGKTYPRPSHLKLIIDILKATNKENTRLILDKLYELLDAPLSEILSEKEIVKLRGAYSLSMYLMKSYLSNFEHKFSTIPFRYMDDTISIFENYIEEINKELYLKRIDQINTNYNTDNLLNSNINFSKNINEKNNTSIEFDLPKGISGNINIKVAGIGGGGIDLLNYFDIITDINNKYFAIDTDDYALECSKNTNKILLSPHLNVGLGTGGNLEIAHNALQESVKILKEELLYDTKILFLITYLGKGIGSIGTPYIAKLAKEMGIFTVVIAITPSRIEGETIHSNCASALSKLKEYSIPIFSYSVDYLFSTINENLKISEIKSLYNSIVCVEIKKFLNFFEVLSLNINNFQNIKKLLSSGEEFYFKHGHGIGDNRGRLAVFNALNDITLRNCLIEKNYKAIIAIRCSELYECTFDEISQMIDELREISKHEIEISYIILFDNNLKKEIELTIIIQNSNYYDIKILQKKSLKDISSDDLTLKNSYDNKLDYKDKLSDILVLNPKKIDNLFKFNTRFEDKLD